MRLLVRLLARLSNRAVAQSMDLRSLGPIHICACGSKILKVDCILEDGAIVLWFTDGECALCGALLKVPTPADVL